MFGDCILLSTRHQEVRERPPRVWGLLLDSGRERGDRGKTPTRVGIALVGLRV